MRFSHKSLLLAALLTAGGAAACAVLRTVDPEAGPANAPEPAPAQARSAAVDTEPASAPGTAPAGGTPAEVSRAAVPAVDFETEIQPLFERCRPCHFEGGKMYARLPFDDPETFRALSTEKLFTRIEDEDARALIRAFLDEPVAPP